MRYALLAVLCWPCFALAQALPSSPPPLLPSDVFIAPQDWTAMTDGKTVYYSLDDLFFGRESYLRGTNLVQFQTNDGRCIDGRWFYDSQRRAYCYLWPGQLACFWHVERDDQILVIDVDGGQDGIWDIQTVSSIAEGGFTCHGALTG